MDAFGNINLIPIQTLFLPVCNVPTSKYVFSYAVFINISALKCLCAAGDSLQSRQFAQQDTAYCADHGLSSLFKEKRETSVK